MAIQQRGNKNNKYSTTQQSTTQHTENRTGSFKRKNKPDLLGGLGPQDPTKWGPGAMPQRPPFPGMEDWSTQNPANTIHTGTQATSKYKYINKLRSNTNLP